MTDTTTEQTRKHIKFRSEFFVPPYGYSSKFKDPQELNNAIEQLYSIFERQLEHKGGNGLGLRRVSAPLILPTGRGLNDDLAGWQNKVTGSSPVAGNFEVPNSLAKWKRKKLFELGLKPGQGIYTVMNAIRPDEDVLDNTHSLFVDQYDCEKVINPKNRTLDYLYKTITQIADSIYQTQEELQKQYPRLEGVDTKPIEFVSTDDLQKMRMFRNCSPKEIENWITREKGTVFITGIGGGKWDDRAPDYDDWTLNGDLLVYSNVLGRAVELLSGGIRVDAQTLEKQLRNSGVWDKKKNLEYNKNVFDETYPQTIGWGLGKSRLCMALLDKLHIGEIQSSVWDEKTRDTAEKHNIHLL